jgi:hypothetical protein
MDLKKCLRRMTPLLATLVLHGSASGATFGQLGGRLDQIKATEFFRWFHLEQTEVTRTGAQTVVAFKPSGEKFHPLVTLNVTTDGQDRLQALELVLARVFVDDPRNGVFARDIVKSLLLAVFGDSGDPGLKDLINEIMYPMYRGPGVISRMPPADIKLPEAPTPCYQVYLGRQTACTLDLGNLSLRLENRRAQETPALTVVIRPR